LFGSYTRLLFVAMALLTVLALALARYIQTSWSGRGLRAVRDNEEAAESVGVPTLKLKLFAATASGALMGVAGAPFPLYMSFIEPTSAFSLNYAVSALAMPIIGGTASWVGPVIGAVLLASVQQIVTVTVSSSSTCWSGFAGHIGSGAVEYWGCAAVQEVSSPLRERVGEGLRGQGEGPMTLPLLEVNAPPSASLRRASDVSLSVRRGSGLASSGPTAPARPR
jgi:hypothetical protein